MKNTEGLSLLRRVQLIAVVALCSMNVPMRLGGWSSRVRQQAQGAFLCLILFSVFPFWPAASHFAKRSGGFLRTPIFR